MKKKKNNIHTYYNPKIIALKLLLIFATCWHTPLLSVDTFNTIDQITQYAQAHEEYPDIDNKNWLNPDYTSFYKKNLPTIWERVATFLRLSQKPLWQAKQWKKLLKKITLYRENNAHIGRFVKRIEPVSGSKFIIFSSLFGAFHSLSRCLQYLKKERIIDNTFRILDKKHYIVFNSDAIDISPYILETMTVILKLMEQNPDNIIYIRGKHEDKEYWLNYGLRDELEIRISNLSQEKPPLRTLINRFFNTLPLALYITRKENNVYKTVRISYHDRTYTELDEEKFSSLFAKEVGPTQTVIHNLQEKNVSQKTNIEIETIIKSTNTFRVFLHKTGFAKTTPDKGAVSFVTFSSPTKSQRVVNKFFYDAFTVISIKEAFENWTITLFSQDVREKLGIRKIAKFNLSSGMFIKRTFTDTQVFSKKIKNLQAKLKQKELEIQKLTQTKVLDTEKKVKKSSKKPSLETQIKLGTTLDTTGEQANEGQRITKVLTSYIEKINKKKEIDNKKVILTVMEDESQTKKAKENIQQLLNKRNTDLILAPLGGATTASYLDLVRKKSIAVLFPNTGYSRLRDQNLKYLINFGPGYDKVEPFAFSYVQKQTPAKRFAFFYQKKLANPQALQKITQKLDKKNYVIVSYDPATLKISSKVNKIKAIKPDVLFIFSTPTTAIKLISQIGAINLMKMTIVGYKLCSQEFKTFLQENNILGRYIGIETIPNPVTSNLELFKKMRKQNKMKYIDYFSAHAYIAATIATEMFKAGAYSKKEIINKLEKVKQYDLMGLTLNFDPNTRQLSNSVWVTKGKNKAKKFNLP